LFQYHHAVSYSTRKCVHAVIINRSGRIIKADGQGAMPFGETLC
jgi:hypothetical protein